MRLRILILTLVGIFSITSFSFASMSSSSFEIDWDSLNYGGSDTSDSANYQLKDTVGSAGDGVSSSTNYQNQAGYRGGYEVYEPVTPGAGPGPEPAGCTDETSPVISSISVSDISTSSAVISWTTNEDAPGHVDYGTSTLYETGTASETSATTHSVSLSSLAASTTYYFQVEATDTCSNTATEDGYSFTTTEADVAPANVTSFTATGRDGYVSLSWVNPTDSDFAGTLIIYCLNRFPTSYNDSHCTTIYNGTETNYRHTGLNNGRTYYYGAFAYDAAGNYASGALASATPTAEEEEEICGDSVCGETETEASCPIDCPATPEETCGDEVCNGSETNASCPADCPLTPTDTCGDGICGSSETASSCPADCTTPIGDVCGDETCGSSESSLTCPADCPLTPTDTCGDGTCGSSETASSCPADCTTPTGDVCGDGACSGSESSSTCPADCGEIPPGTTCGNATCEEGETSNNCSSDCPAIEIPETTVSGDEIVPETDLSFWVSDGLIKLSVDNTGNFYALVDSEVSVIFSSDHLIKEVADLLLTFGADTYRLQNSDGSYQTTVTIPGSTAVYALYLIVEYTDGTTQVFERFVHMVSAGQVVEQEENNEIPVAGATVTLYVNNNGNWTIWTPANGQSNPLASNENGEFSWYVENGLYKIYVQKDGYAETETSSLETTNNIINQKIFINKIPETIQIIENISQTIESVQTFVQDLQSSPTTQVSAQVAAPIITVTAIATTVALASAFDLLPLLQYLITSPILFFGRRKRKAYGIVYNALTKTPIDLALVRLYRLADGKLIRSRVTDRGGRYFFLVQPGQYKIEAFKNGFHFPSSTLADIKDDAIYLDVYHGEAITVTDKDVVITPNIPLEPIAAETIVVPKKVKRNKHLRQIQKWTALTGILVSLYVFLVRMSVTSAVLVGCQIIIYLLVRRLATPRKPKSWGIVYDKKTRRPLSDVIVRIFEPKYHKLLETGVTDSRGRYTFLLGPNQYSSTFEKPGYQPAEISPIDYTNEKEVREWAQDIELSPENKATPTDPQA